MRLRIEPARGCLSYKLFDEFRKNAPRSSRGASKGTSGSSPRVEGVGSSQTGPMPSTSTSTWTRCGNMYATEKKTPSGKYIGKAVKNGALTFTPVGGGKAIQPAEEALDAGYLPGRTRTGGQPQFLRRLQSPRGRRSGRLARRLQVLPGRAVQLVLQVPPRAQHRPQVPTASATTTTPNRPRTSPERAPNLIVTLFWDCRRRPKRSRSNRTQRRSWASAGVRGTGPRPPFRRSWCRRKEIRNKPPSCVSLLLPDLIRMRLRHEDIAMKSVYCVLVGLLIATPGCGQSENWRWHPAWPRRKLSAGLRKSRCRMQSRAVERQRKHRLSERSSTPPISA